MKMGCKRVETITDHISLIKGKNKGRFPYSHSILILDEEIVLIDTGCGIETLKQLKREYDISYVINSHTHPDHSAGNWVFNDRPIYVPEEGFDTSGDVVALSERFVSKKLAQVWQRFAKNLMGLKDCSPTNSYNGGTAFGFGKINLETIYTPGHTSDHYCFYEQKEKILFSFDYDLTPFPWYGHRESSIPKFRESVKKLKALSPKAVVSSHRGVITKNIDAEFDQFYTIIDERDGKILSLLESEKTVDQLVECAPIYGEFPYAESLLRYWEGQMVKKHLEQLEIDGKVKRLKDLSFVKFAVGS
jgi:glyoxylase-like metal-dependent hydrolase (beta-lactamase superfamily II)